MLLRLTTIAALLAACIAPGAANAQADRGAYLAALGGCSHCHTPGHFFGKPDMARKLGGSDVAFAIPNLGFFAGPNLTPDKETGLGNWSDAEIEKVLRTGVRPDNRILAPSMPWMDYASLTDADMKALIAYLRGLPAVKNKVAGPFGPQEKPTIAVMTIVPPGGAR